MRGSGHPRRKSRTLPGRSPLADDRRRDDHQGVLHPIVLALLEALLAAAVRDRLTFRPEERVVLEGALFTLEEVRYAAEGEAICARIASLQEGQGPPTSGAP